MSRCRPKTPSPTVPLLTPTAITRGVALPPSSFDSQTPSQLKPEYPCAQFLEALASPSHPDAEKQRSLLNTACMSRDARVRAHSMGYLAVNRQGIAPGATRCST